GLTPRLGRDTLLYLSWRGGRQGIWLLQRGATRELWGTTRARIVGGPAIAADGHVAFTVADNDRTVLYAMDLDGSHLRILTDELSLRGEPAWTPDSRAVISAALRAGEPRLMRIPVNGDAPLPLVSEYSMNPVWSPDGQFLVYAGADVGTTFPLRAAAADGRPHPLPSLMLTRGARVAFFRDGHTLMMLHGEIGHMNLWLIDLLSGAQKLLAALPPEFTSRDFAVAVNGSEVMLDRIEENADIALIERPF
ncbi:MAG TPA: DNA-binding protein, partial [Candidatus Dormibacteraeota bacterium]|nr:DNA-binding protein [Candidatus Dormibacteraeota bacterium]